MDTTKPLNTASGAKDTPLAQQIFKKIKKHQYSDIQELLGKQDNLSFLYLPLKIKNANGFSLLHFLARDLYGVSDELYIKEKQEQNKLIGYLLSKNVDFTKTENKYHTSPIDFLIFDGAFHLAIDHPKLFKNYDFTAPISEQFMEIYRDKIHHYQPIEPSYNNYVSLSYGAKIKTMPKLFTIVDSMRLDWVITNPDNGGQSSHSNLLFYFLNHFKIPEIQKLQNSDGMTLLDIIHHSSTIQAETPTFGTQVENLIQHNIILDELQNKTHLDSHQNPGFKVKSHL